MRIYRITAQLIWASELRYDLLLLWLRIVARTTQNETGNMALAQGHSSFGASRHFLDGAESAPKPEKRPQTPRETRQIEAEKRD